MNPALLFLAGLTAAFSLSAHADFEWTGNPTLDPARRKITYTAMIGLRLFGHYTLSAPAISTPPTGFHGEAQAQFTYDQRVTGYVFYSQGVFGPFTRTFGGGAQYPFLAFTSPRFGWLTRLQAYVLTDLGGVTFPTPVPPKTYDASALCFRYGLGARWLIKSWQIALETQFLVTQVVSNFFIAPSAGIRIPIGPQ